MTHRYLVPNPWGYEASATLTPTAGGCNPLQKNTQNYFAKGIPSVKTSQGMHQRYSFGAFGITGKRVNAELAHIFYKG